MKRFWRDARAAPHPEGFWVELDGKPVRLPGGDKLLIKTRVLAAAVAEEWDGAPDEFVMDALPLTRLAATAQGRIAPDAEPVAMALARYAETDLLCYRADSPPELAARQSALWQPWLDRAAARYGARLRVTNGVGYVAQDRDALAILAAIVASCDAATIAALGVLTPALGSLVLAMAVVEGALPPVEAFRLSALDELFQAEHWGEDGQAAVRRADIAEDIAVAARFVELARA